MLQRWICSICYHPNSISRSLSTFGLVSKYFCTSKQVLLYEQVDPPAPPWPSSTPRATSLALTPALLLIYYCFTTVLLQATCELSPTTPEQHANARGAREEGGGEEEERGAEYTEKWGDGDAEVGVGRGGEGMAFQLFIRPRCSPISFGQLLPMPFGPRDMGVKRGLFAAQVLSVYLRY